MKGVNKMKISFKIVRLVLFFISIVIPAFCFQLEKQFGETSCYLKDICMIGSEIGWAVGAPHWDQNVKYYKGTIIKTTDGGENWAEQEAGIYEELRGVCFVDLNNGWAVGANGTILHTDNGGDTWIQQTVATTDEFRGVVFTDANNGWATSIEVVHYDWNDEPDDWRGSIWHTSNGGQNWIKQTVPDSTSILNRIDFIDSLNGWAVGIKFIDDSGIFPEHVGAFYSTGDGGLTWEEHLSPEPEIVFTGVDMINDTNTFVVGFKMNSAVDSGTIFRTTDNGENWEQQDPGYTLWDVQFLNPDSGYAIGCMYGAAWGPPILQTLNGGADWELLNIDKHAGEGLYGLALMDDKVITVGDCDFLSATDNPWGADSTFKSLFSQQYINIHYRFEEIFFIDENRGWAVGRRTYLPELWGQVILYTDNGGATWETQYEYAPPLDDLFSFFALNDVYFTDDHNGWAVGNSEWYWEESKHYGSILHTDDGGTNWEEQGTELYEGRDREFVAVQFLDSLNGWALAEMKFPSDSIYLTRTTNGGVSWEWVNAGIECLFGMSDGDLFFTDSQNAWAVGLKVIHTNDGGSSWQEQSLPYIYEIHGASFTSTQTGWIAGEGLYYTTDGGSLWQEKDVGVVWEFYDIQFADPLTGCLVGDRGTVMNTDNGGDSWNLQTDEYVTLNTLRGIHLVNDSIGWASGDAGTIIKIKMSGGAYIEEDDQGTNIPAQITLLQNYPNPFNSSTKIEYTIHKTAFVEILIYNSLGQLVNTLVKGEQQKGNHYVLWDGRDNSGQFVASGLYYYLLKTKGATLYRKMLLLK